MAAAPPTADFCWPHPSPSPAPTSANAAPPRTAPAERGRPEEAARPSTFHRPHSRGVPRPYSVAHALDKSPEEEASFPLFRGPPISIRHNASSHLQAKTQWRRSLPDLFAVAKAKVATSVRSGIGLSYALRQCGGSGIVPEHDSSTAAAGSSPNTTVHRPRHSLAPHRSAFQVCPV